MDAPIGNLAHASSEALKDIVKQNPTDFLVITPLPEELDSVLKRLPNPRKIQSLPDDIRIYYFDNLPVEVNGETKHKYSIVGLPLAKMGETEAASATSIAIQRWHPRYVLLVGIAGDT